MDSLQISPRMLLYFAPVDQDLTPGLAEACVRSQSLIRETWGLEEPQECRVYLMTSPLQFLFHTTPWFMRVFYVLVFPLLYPRLHKLWRYCGGMTLGFRNRPTAGVKPPRLLQQADRSIGKLIFEEEPDLTRKMEQSACHAYRPLYRVAGLAALLKVLVMFVLPVAASAGPVIDRETRTINLTEPMRIALREFNPAFRVWNLGDYTPTIVRHFARENVSSLPFAVICDANRDGRPDVILDGHDGKRALLIALISKGKAYKAIPIEGREEVDPASIENEFEGEKERGIPAYLWPVDDDKQTAARVEVFYRLCPQQSTKDGELLNDGGFVEYSFQEDRFFISAEFIL